MRRVVVLVSVSALVVAGALPARAYVPERTPRRELEAGARRLLSHRAARRTVSAVMVMRGGRVLYSHNAEVAMLPASLMKLATTTAAVLRFGPRHRFVTQVLAEGPLPNVKTLYLVGGGDPTLATSGYRRARFLPKPTDEFKRPAFRSGSPTIGSLAARVRAAGVRLVSGDLVIDETLFDQVRTQPGWIPSYTAFEPDSGLLTALPVNEGRGDVKGNTLLRDPAYRAGDALRAALARRGVRVEGRIRRGRAPAGAHTVARAVSPPLAELIDYINRYSVNFPSELLLKSLGARFGRAGSTVEGVAVVTQTLREAGIPLDGFNMADGSGLSLLNRVQSHTIAALLHRIATGSGPTWRTLRSSLPAAGGPGTLRTRMRVEPVRGNLRGKTGQIREVRAMAGWVHGRDGVPIVYVAIFNEAPSPFALTSPLDLFGLWLARFPRP